MRTIAAINETARMVVAMNDNRRRILILSVLTFAVML